MFHFLTNWINFPFLPTLRFGALHLYYGLPLISFGPCRLLHSSLTLCFNCDVSKSMQASLMAYLLSALTHTAPMSALISASVLAASSYLDRLSALLLSASDRSNCCVLSLLLDIYLELTSSYLADLPCFLIQMATLWASILSLYLATNLYISAFPPSNFDRGRHIWILCVVCRTSPCSLSVFPPTVASFLPFRGIKLYH